MSRSYREPWVKDHPKGVKTLHARRERRIIRIMTKLYSKTYNWEDDFHLILPSRREITNPYDISDFRFPWTNDPKGCRK